MTRHLSDRKRSALRHQLIAYLAETMPEAQREDFERRLLNDDAFSEQIHQVQQELLEDYAAGVLSSVHRKQLGPWVFYSSGRRQQVQLTADLLYQAHRAKIITLRRYVAIAIACVLLVVGIRMLHPLQYLRNAPSSSATHAGLPMPTFTTTAPSEPSTFDASATSAGADIVRPMIIRLVPEHVHGEVPVNPTAYAIQAASPILLQILVPPSSHDREYTLTVHFETAAVPDRRFDHLTPLTLGGGRYVEADFSPGSLPPGQYIAQLFTEKGVFMVGFIVHF